MFLLLSQLGISALFLKTTLVLELYILFRGVLYKRTRNGHKEHPDSKQQFVWTPQKTACTSACAVFHRVGVDTGGSYQNPSPSSKGWQRIFDASEVAMRVHVCHLYQKKIN